MSREKKHWILVTFHTTTEAIAMEKACTKQRVPGRLIPVPTQIAAGCGMAWRTEPEERERLQQWMEQWQLAREEIYDISM